MQITLQHVLNGFYSGQSQHYGNDSIYHNTELVSLQHLSGIISESDIWDQQEKSLTTVARIQTNKIAKTPHKDGQILQFWTPSITAISTGPSMFLYQ